MAEFILSGFADEAASNFDTQLEVLKQVQIEFIEIRLVDGINIIDLDNEKVKKIKDKLQENNIKVSAIGSYIGKIKITHNFTIHLDSFKRAVEIALQLEAPYIRLFSFYIPQNEDAAIYRDEVFERMSAILEAARGSGVICCHENEKDIYGDTPLRVLDLLKTFEEDLKGIFDPANFIQCNVKDTAEAFRLLYPYTQYMHIKDARLTDGAVVPAGFGDGKIAELVNLFSQKEGKRFLTLEPHLSVFEGYDKLGDDRSIKNEFVYENSQEAFLAGVNAFKTILNEKVSD